MERLHQEWFAAQKPLTPNHPSQDKAGNEK
jgi:hypothetical protein